MPIDSPTNYYFCWILPKDDDINFWSKHFDEYVFRLVTEWKIVSQYAEKFFLGSKMAHEILDSSDWFRRTNKIIKLMH